jgi:hypothetical protein
VTPSAHELPTVTEMPLASLRELTGTIIDGRYEVAGLLACGGMGAVYEAVHLQLDRRVAIKVLNPVFMHKDDYVARFMLEAKAASRIRHENVVQMLDFGRLPGSSVYSVMEFLEGRDLSQVLRQETKLEWPRARALLLQIIRGLEAAHAQGVIHRDVKPANLFLAREDGRDVLKVLDFGIARLQGGAGETGALTGAADLLGTPAYMAPELARGRHACPRTEVYSVGVVAYRMITGQLPFRGESAFDALFRAATEPTPPVRSHDPTVPPAIEALIMRMLAKDPMERCADMAELHREVAAIDDDGRGPGDSIVATGALDRLAALPALLATPRARRMFVQACGAAGVAGLVAGTMALLQREHPSSTEMRTTMAASVVAPHHEASASVQSVVEVMPAPPLVVIEHEGPPEVAPESAPAVKRPRTPTKPPKATAIDVPPTDAEVLRRLERRARVRCGDLLGGEPLRVTFGIGQRGEVIAARGSRKGPAADCVVALLGESRFAAGSMRKEQLTL